MDTPTDLIALAITGVITGVFGIIQSLVNRTNHTKLKSEFEYAKGGIDQAVPLVHKLVESGQLQTGVNALESVSPSVKKAIDEHSTQIQQITQVLNNALPLLSQLQQFVKNPTGTGQQPPEPTNNTTTPAA